MLFEGLEKKMNKYMVGYDLGDEFSQISYAALNQENPETVPVVAGSQQYNIPTVLCKRNEINQWLYGKEALRVGQAGDGTLLENLLERACKGEIIALDEREYDAVALLTLFVKKSFGLFNMVAPLEKIEIVVFTVRGLDQDKIRVLSSVVDGLDLKTNRIYFQDYMESFYGYMLHQPEPLWKGKSVILDFQKNHFIQLTLECNYRTTPIVSFANELAIDGIEYPQFSEEEAERRLEYSQFDSRFAEKIEDIFGDQYISSVFLIGEGFQEEWAEKSLQILCRGRRVFKGNNLYSKGAAYSAMEKLCPSQSGKEHVFLGKEKLKANIGLSMFREGEEVYLALMDAGISWYDVKAEKAFYLEEGNSFLVKITPLTGIDAQGISKEKYPVRWEEIHLDGLPDRKGAPTRLLCSMYMLDEKNITIEVKDLGFGEIFPKTGKEWKQEISIVQ